MRTLAFVLVALLSWSAQATTTQTVKQARLRQAFTRAGMHPSAANLLLQGLANVLYYDTYAELAAAAPQEGSFGWAQDTDAMYYYTGAAWTALLSASSSGLLGTNSGTIGNETDNVWALGENSEDMTFTFGTNSVTMASTTGAVFTFAPASTFSGDATFDGGAGAITFGAASSSIVVPDDSATALKIGSAGTLGLITVDSTDDNEEVNIVGTTATSAFRVDTGFATFDEQAVLTGGASFGAALTSSVTAADVLTLSGAAPTMTLKDNAAAALTIQSSGAANMLVFDTSTDNEELNVNGTAATSAFRVDTGFATFDEQAVLTGGASFGAALTSSVTAADVLTLSGAAPTVTLKDNEAAALTVKSSGAAALLVLGTLTDNEVVEISGTTAADALHVDVGTSQFDESVTIGDGAAGADFVLAFNGEDNDGSITYMEDEDRLDFDNAISVGDIVTIDGGAGALTCTSGDASIVLADDDTSALDIGAAGNTSLIRVSTEDDLEKVTIAGHTGDTAFRVDTGEAIFDEGVDMAVPAMLLETIRFCGNGSNGNTPMYSGPVLPTDMDTDMSFGGVACDANDDTTETNVDDDAVAGFAYKPTGMVCAIAAGGTDDTVTFQLREDQSDVTGITCNVVMDGAAAKQCSVRLVSPETVAAGSLVDIKIVAENEDLTAIDAECRVFVTF